MEDFSGIKLQGPHPKHFLIKWQDWNKEIDTINT